jgi:hypothetical protein
MICRAVAAIAISMCLTLEVKSEWKKASALQQLLDLDPFGLLLFIPAIVCILLALHVCIILHCHKVTLILLVGWYRKRMERRSHHCPFGHFRRCPRGLLLCAGPEWRQSYYSSSNRTPAINLGFLGLLILHNERLQCTKLLSPCLFPGHSRSFPLGIRRGQYSPHSI